MYHSYECGAWYSAAHEEGETKEWCLTFNKKGRISDVNVGGKDAWFMYGPVYLSREFSAKFLPVLEAYYQIPGTEQFYWEQPYVDMLKGEAKTPSGKRGQGAVETDRRSLRHTCVQMERDRDEYQPPAG